MSTIPPECRAPINERNSLALWHQRGYFIVQGATKRRFDLRTAPVDLGSALLADTEHFLDCAAEHHVSLRRYVNATDWLSPAWTTVTFYYWAYFLCLAVTRLLGQTVWFLDRKSVRTLLSLASNSSGSPGGGSFILTCGAVTSMSERELTLTKAGGRVHDELWIQWAKLCESKLNRLTTGSSTSLEERLFTALVRASQLLGQDWPSAFRNAVNYRPAFAYSAVRRMRVLKSFTHLRTPPTYDCTSILNSFEANLAPLRNAGSIASEPQAVAELLIHYTFLMHALADALYWELLDRHGLDRRWGENRTRFLRNNNIYTGNQRWPC